MLLLNPVWQGRASRSAANDEVCVRTRGRSAAIKLHNLRDMTERMLDRERAVNRAADAQMAERAAGAAVVESRPPLMATERRSRRAQERHARSHRRQERFTVVQQVHRQGLGIHGIARQLGMSRNTVLDIVLHQLAGFFRDRITE